MSVPLASSKTGMGLVLLTPLQGQGVSPRVPERDSTCLKYTVWAYLALLLEPSPWCLPPCARLPASNLPTSLDFRVRDVAPGTSAGRGSREGPPLLTGPLPPPCTHPWQRVCSRASARLCPLCGYKWLPGLACPPPVGPHMCVEPVGTCGSRSHPPGLPHLPTAAAEGGRPAREAGGGLGLAAGEAKNLLQM